MTATRRGEALAALNLMELWLRNDGPAVSEFLAFYEPEGKDLGYLLRGLLDVNLILFTEPDGGISESTWERLADVRRRLTRRGD
jgi:hypothetical protein